MQEFLYKYSILPKEFIDDFYEITKYDYNTDDFIIDFDTIIKWLDIRKDSFKRLLLKHFKNNIDYKIIKTKIKNKNRGSNYVDKIYVTSNCFKELCMLSLTPKAKEVKMYFLELERIIQMYYKDIHKQAMEELKLIKNNQKPKINHKGGIIYIIKAYNTNYNLYKIGKTSNLKQRLDSYNQQNANDIEPIFIIRTDNITKTENCIKNYAKDYQYRKYKEIYEIDVYLLKKILLKCTSVTKSFLKLFAQDKEKTTLQLKRIRENDNNLYMYLHKNE